MTKAITSSIPNPLPFHLCKTEEDRERVRIFGNLGVLPSELIFAFLSRLQPQDLILAASQSRAWKDLTYEYCRHKTQSLFPSFFEKYKDSQEGWIGIYHSAMVQARVMKNKAQGLFAASIISCPPVKHIKTFAVGSERVAIYTKTDDVLLIAPQYFRKQIAVTTTDGHVHHTIQVTGPFTIHKHLLYMVKGESIEVWNLHTGAHVNSITGHQGIVNYLIYSGSHLFYFTEDDREMYSWDTRTTKLRQHVIWTSENERKNSEIDFTLLHSDENEVAITYRNLSDRSYFIRRWPLNTDRAVVDWGDSQVSGLPNQSLVYMNGLLIKFTLDGLMITKNDMPFAQIEGLAHIPELVTADGKLFTIAVQEGVNEDDPPLWYLTAWDIDTGAQLACMPTVPTKIIRSIGGLKVVTLSKSEDKTCIKVIDLETQSVLKQALVDFPLNKMKEISLSAYDGEKITFCFSDSQNSIYKIFAIDFTTTKPIALQYHRSLRMDRTTKIGRITDARKSIQMQSIKDYKPESLASRITKQIINREISLYKQVPGLIVNRFVRTLTTIYTVALFVIICIGVAIIVAIDAVITPVRSLVGRVRVLVGL